MYQDRYIAVVNKPSGLLSQPDRGRTSPSVACLLESEHRTVALHHRLDRPASGLMLVVLDPAANAPIARAFQERTIQRFYRAVVAGTPHVERWTTPVDRKAARTHIVNAVSRAGVSAVELALDTGRKHQIRIQSAQAGHPVLGDRRYGAEVGHAWPRLALHAFRLKLTHPIHGEALDIESPIPNDLVALWRQAGGT